MATSPRKAAKAAEAAAESLDKNFPSSSLEDDIAQLRKEVAKLASQLSKTGQKSYDTARRAATEGVDQLKSQGEAALGDFKTGAGDIERHLTDAVRDKPVTSLAIAAGVGFLFALFSRR